LGQVNGLLEVSRSRSRSMTLLYSTAVRLWVRLVRRRGLSFRFRRSERKMSPVLRVLSADLVGFVWAGRLLGPGLVSP
jgi:hypothetical protein